MTSFRIPISERSKAVARFVGDVYEQTRRAFATENARSGLTQVELAEKLGVNKSVINRELKGATNLTIRRVAELAWALGYEIDLRFRPKSGNAVARRVSAEAGSIVFAAEPLLYSSGTASSFVSPTVSANVGTLSGGLATVRPVTVRLETCH